MIAILIVINVSAYILLLLVIIDSRRNVPTKTLIGLLLLCTGIFAVAIKLLSTVPIEHINQCYEH